MIGGARSITRALRLTLAIEAPVHARLDERRPGTVEQTLAAVGTLAEELPLITLIGDAHATGAVLRH